jgi:hypothetical protein
MSLTSALKSKYPNITKFQKMLLLRLETISG